MLAVTQSQRKGKRVSTVDCNTHMAQCSVYRKENTAIHTLHSAVFTERRKQQYTHFTVQCLQKGEYSNTHTSQCSVYRKENTAIHTLHSAVFTERRKQQYTHFTVQCLQKRRQQYTRTLPCSVYRRGDSNTHALHSAVFTERRSQQHGAERCDAGAHRQRSGRRWRRRWWWPSARPCPACPR